MVEKDFKINNDGFTGHLYYPEKETDKAVIIVMGGEKSILPPKWMAERFAELGIMALAIGIYGDEGLPKEPDRIPIDMIKKAAMYLKISEKVNSITAYGVSMGSIVVSMAATVIKEIIKWILS